MTERACGVQWRHLAYFLAVAEEGSVNAAAAALYLASSGVSHAIAELERQVGVTLFVRSRTGMRLTAAGHQMVGPARQALAAFDAALAAPGGVRQGATATLDVVSTLSLAQEPTATILGFLHRRHPAVQIHLNEPPGPSVSSTIDSVLAGTNQVAVTELPGAPVPGTRITRMRDLEYWVVCPPGSLRGVGGSDGGGASDDVVALERVLDIGLIVAPSFESSLGYRRLQAAAARLGRSLDRSIVVRNEHRDSFMSLVRSGAGAALLHRVRATRARQLGCEAGRLDSVPPTRIAAVTRAGPQPVVVEDFLELCASVEVADVWDAAHERLP